MYGYDLPVYAFVAFVGMSAVQVSRLPIDPAMSFSRDDLPHLTEVIESRCAQLPRTRFEEGSMRGLVELLRPGKATLLPLASELKAIDSNMELKSRRIVDLTSAQAEAMRVMNGSSSVVVKGSAGTGKTLIAVERAAQLAACNHRVLYALGDGELLAERIDSEFRRRELNVRVEVGERVIANYWDRERQKFNAFGGESFDAVIVDEAQLFGRMEDRLLSWLQSVPLVYFFGDPHQAMGSGDANVPCFLNSTHVNLSENCRNTSPISEAARTFAPWVKSAADLTGPAPLVFAVDDSRQRVRSVSGVVNHLRSEGIELADIAVLLASSASIVSTDYLTEVREELASSGIEPADLGGCCHAWSFVGMEASAIVLIDIGWPPIRAFRRIVTSQKRELYLAITRARGILAVVTSRRTAKWLQHHMDLNVSVEPGAAHQML